MATIYRVFSCNQGLSPGFPNEFQALAAGIWASLAPNRWKCFLEEVARQVLAFAAEIVLKRSQA
jgi:hypothetical protein